MAPFSNLKRKSRLTSKERNLYEPTDMTQRKWVFVVLAMGLDSGAALSYGAQRQEPCAQMQFLRAVSLLTQNISFFNGFGFVLGYFDDKSLIHKPASGELLIRASSEGISDFCRSC